MADNVVTLETPKPPDLLVGPFKRWRVLVSGRFVPRLTGWREGDTFWLCVDNRFAQDFSTENDARSAAELIAQASAIFSGYSHFAAPNKDMPFAPEAHGIDMSEPHDV